MHPLVVYTAITKGDVKDQLQPSVAPSDPAGRAVHFVCFTDTLVKATTNWEIRPLQFEHPNPRRAARWHKCMSHDLFPTSLFTFWHDASHQLTSNPWELVDRHLVKGVDFASFCHPERSSIYEELKACIRLRKDDPATMRRQVDRYKVEGYHANHLFETSAVLRRHTEIIRSLNHEWWQQIREGSVRDQLSLDYVVAKLKVPYAHLPGHREKSPHFRFHPHR